MSLYFTKAKKAKSQSRSTAPVKRTKQSAETLHRLGCRACPLNKEDILSPQMEPSGSKKPLILFMGEGPGQVEDETNEPFVGPSGKFLREWIHEDFEEDVAFSNVVQCRPPGNRTPDWIEVECCRPRNNEQISQLKPKFIVGLGGTAFQWALGKSPGELKNLRGRLFAINVGGHDCWFYSTWHPSFVKRQSIDNRDPIRTRIGHCFKMDLMYVFGRADD